jgi:predicted CxxxxCH...CXXCH cytochrome family protein
MEKSEILLIVFIGMLTLGLAYASGKYDIMAPTNLEIEDNPQLSCSQGDGTTGSCHMINATFAGLTADNGAKGIYDIVEDYKAYNNLGPFAGSGIPHPGSGRVPASTFPRWVHMQHGDGNWPMWRAGPFYYDSAKGQWKEDIDWDYLTSPIDGVPSPDNRGGASPINPTVAGIGRADQDIGDNVGIDIGPFRFPYRAGDGKQYWADTTGNGIIVGENTANVIDALGYIATLNNPVTNRGPDGFGGCAYGTQPDDPGAGYNPGCHGLWSVDPQLKVEVNVTRTDSPACTDCHNTVTAANFNHRTLDPATNCATCHNVGGTTLSAANGVPEVRNCYECHTTGLKISPTVNTTYAHAGVDCRYCHGHGHNVTIQDVGGSGYGVTCGSGDDSCHGAGAPAPRNVGNIQHGQSVTKGCVDCHVTATGSASGHDIRIPACSDCHTSTGVGGKSVAAQPVPSWDSSNAIYHGNANKTCQDCHGVSTPHDNAITASTPSCTQAGCHDGTGTGPTAINEVHASGVAGATPLTCEDCHNNVTITYNGTTYYPNASIHSTNATKLIPFGMSYGSDSMTPNDCVKCHSDQNSFFSGGNPLACDSCHSTTNAYGVKTLTVHSVDMGQPGAQIDGVHSASCNTCHSSRDDGMPDGTKTYADAGNTGNPPLHGNTYYTDNKHSYHVDILGASCDNCHNGYSMPDGTTTINFGGTWNGIAVTGVYNYSDPYSSCYNVSCHVRNLLPEDISPNGYAWETTATLDCSSCHYATPPSGKHTNHINSQRSVNGVAADCTWCHGSNANNDNHTGHRNGYPDVILASGGSYSNTSDECAGSCHAGNDATSKPQWYAASALGCKSCHASGSKAPNAGWNVASSFIDYSAFENSVHADVAGDRTLADDNDCKVCHTDATYSVMVAATDYEATGNANTKTCYSCHGGGN